MATQSLSIDDIRRLTTNVTAECGNILGFLIDTHKEIDPSLLKAPFDGIDSNRGLEDAADSRPMELHECLGIVEELDEIEKKLDQTGKPNVPRPLRRFNSAASLSGSTLNLASEASVGTQLMGPPPPPAPIERKWPVLSEAELLEFNSLKEKCINKLQGHASADASLGLQQRICRSFQALKEFLEVMLTELASLKDPSGQSNRAACFDREVCSSLENLSKVRDFFSSYRII